MRYWQFGCDHPQPLLREYGWDAEVSQPQDTQNAHGRYPSSMPIEADVGGQQENRGVWLVQARRIP